LIRLTLLHNLYEQSHQGLTKSVLFDTSNSSFFSSFRSAAQGKPPADSRLRTLEHVGERLNELESIVTSYRPDRSELDCTPMQTKSFGQNYNVELDGDQMSTEHREIERLHLVDDQVSSPRQCMSTPPISPPRRAPMCRPLFQFDRQKSSSEEDDDDFQYFTDEEEELDDLLPTRPSRLQQSVNSLLFRDKEHRRREICLELSRLGSIDVDEQ
jgi:hypothetical protein